MQAEVVVGICNAAVNVVFSGQHLFTLKSFTACYGKWVTVLTPSVALFLKIVVEQAQYLEVLLSLG